MTSNNQIKYTYDAMDRVVTMEYPDGEVVTNSYNHQGLLESLTYTYAPVGNMTRIVDGQAPNGTQTLLFQYDHPDQLTYANANGSIISQGGYTREYDYDKIGNINWRKDNGTTVTYDYPQSGPNSVRPHSAIATGGNNSYAYDDNGNMTDRTIHSGSHTGEYNLVYNVENKLESVTANSETATTTGRKRSTGAGRTGRVLRATTSQGTGFGIRYPTSGSIDVPLNELSVWIKDTGTFYFYVRVHATNGSDYYIRYQPTDGSSYASGSYAIVPVGTQYRDGSWRELRRDLGADLKTVFGVGVEYVKWFCIRGGYDLDGLTLTAPTKYYYAPSTGSGQAAGQRAWPEPVEGLQ